MSLTIVLADGELQLIKKVQLKEKRCVRTNKNTIEMANVRTNICYLKHFMGTNYSSVRSKTIFNVATYFILS